MADTSGQALLVFDGDCEFCRFWIDRWRDLTGERVLYAPASEIAVRFPDMSSERSVRALQLIDRDGRHYEGASAVFRILACAPGLGWLTWFYEAPLVAPVSEAAYRFVAGHRPFFLKLTRLFWGRRFERPRYRLTGRIFLQALSAVYFIAFISLIPQLPGLVGRDGLLPLAAHLAGLKTRLGGLSYWAAPTLAWLNPGAGALQFMGILGAVAALLAFGGILTGPCFLLMWTLYLSLTVAGQDFTAFQWDNLLLEAGFLALFLAPFRFRASYASRIDTSAGGLWLFRFLLFRLTFSSGIINLLSGDATWRNLTVLRFYFETQPLPTALAWYAHHLPGWLLSALAASALAVGIIVPFLFFLPRRARLFGAAITAVSQLLLIATGNFAFFNWLTLVLCLTLLDDAVFERLWPKWKERKSEVPSGDAGGEKIRWAARFVAIAVVVLGLTQLAALFGRLPRPLLFLAAAQAPFRLVNAYGPFSLTATRRAEIVIEGSNDGITWKTYPFRHKPGDVRRAPEFIAPFHPRLDGQMWSAALGEAAETRWFPGLMARLLQGSPSVLALFAGNPFPDKPPIYVRATLYLYRFSTPAERKTDGSWWRRQVKAEYFPPATLSSLLGGHS